MDSADAPQVVLPQLMLTLWPYAMVLLPLLVVALLAWFIWRGPRRGRGAGRTGRPSGDDPRTRRGGDGR